jgi:hypothetical protein
MNSNYNCEEWDPVDGTVIDACDKLAAMVEAATYIGTGSAPRPSKRVEGISLKNTATP